MLRWIPESHLLYSPLDLRLSIAEWLGGLPNAHVPIRRIDSICLVVRTMIFFSNFGGPPAGEKRDRDLVGPIFGRSHIHIDWRLLNSIFVAGLKVPVRPMVLVIPILTCRSVACNG